MNSNKASKISLGIGIGVSIVGLLYCLGRQISPPVSAPGAPVSETKIQTDVRVDVKILDKTIEKSLKSSLDSSKNAPSMKAPAQQDPDCEIAQESKPDAFMEGALADAEDDSGIAWGSAEKGDDAGEAAAFEKQAKAFRTIAGELSEKQPTVKNLKKNCVAKK